MRINEHIALSTPKLLLVPYSSHHVPTYHEWMKDPDLQAATASEPLTLKEEYAMQVSWRKDHDKLTFIICLPPESPQESITLKSHDAPDRMVGDINLFLFKPDTEEDSSEDQLETDPGLIGELELMIARKELQRHGYGRAALLVFIQYILSNWQTIAEEYNGTKDTGNTRICYLRVRINQSNAGSIALFESLQFHRVSPEPNYFGEIELRWRPVTTSVQADCRILPYLLESSG